MKGRVIALGVSGLAALEGLLQPVEGKGERLAAAALVDVDGEDRDLVDRPRPVGGLLGLVAWAPSPTLCPRGRDLKVY